MRVTRHARPHQPHGWPSAPSLAQPRGRHQRRAATVASAPRPQLSAKTQAHPVTTRTTARARSSFTCRTSRHPSVDQAGGLRAGMARCRPRFAGRTTIGAPAHPGRIPTPRGLRGPPAGHHDRAQALTLAAADHLDSAVNVTCRAWIPPGRHADPHRPIPSGRTDRPVRFGSPPVVEQDEGCGGDRADLPRAQADPAQRLERENAGGLIPSEARVAQLARDNAAMVEARVRQTS